MSIGLYQLSQEFKSVGIRHQTQIESGNYHVYILTIACVFSIKLIFVQVYTRIGLRRCRVRSWWGAMGAPYRIQLPVICVHGSAWTPRMPPASRSTTARTHNPASYWRFTAWRFPPKVLWVVAVHITQVSQQIRKVFQKPEEFYWFVGSLLVLKAMQNRKTENVIEENMAGHLHSIVVTHLYRNPKVRGVINTG